MASTPRRPPPSTPEQSETQLIGLAYDLAEKQLREGSASPSVVTHLLKLGSTRAQFELERMKNENLLLAARTESIEAQARLEEKHQAVLDAIMRYTGSDEDVYDED